MGPGCHNFHKPNMSFANPVHQEVLPALQDGWYTPLGRTAATDKSVNACNFFVKASLPDDSNHGFVHSAYGAPDTVWRQVNITVLNRNVGGGKRIAIDIDFQMFNKTATRLAEASWMSFIPPVADFRSGWRLRGF